MDFHLSWLPGPPPEFRQKCKAIASRRGSDAFRELALLAGYALDESKMHILANAIARARRTEGSPTGFSPFRLGILANATTGFLPAPLIVSALRHGVDLTLAIGNYGQVFQDAADPKSGVNLARPDAVLLAIDHRGLPIVSELGVSHELHVSKAIKYLAQVADALRLNGCMTIIFQSLAPPPEALFGSLDAVVNGTDRATIADFNSELRRLVRTSPGSLLLDVEAMAGSVGFESWHDPVQWNLAKVPFAQQFLSLYAEHIGRLLAAMRGRSRKCLVLDLDNTIWGGVIGDDGPEGIVLGNGSPHGEAFLDVQRTVLRLRERGILLAVCSKNNEATARAPFRSHPDMLIREEHIAVFQANWIDKGANLAAIARELNIGLDALVLLDDNPAERAQVRGAQPDVAVPELPEDPSLYARTLLQAGYFEAVSFSSDDKARAAQYQGNVRRAELQAGSADLATYLQSLKMVAIIGPFTPPAIPRVAQLINKSNQFNLTTKRYTEAEIRVIAEDSSVYTQQIRLNDCFGDNGIISVIICRPEGRDWNIDTWLMSCRVLGRQVERLALNQIVENACARGVSRLLGRFVPTGRNELVREHYTKLGFKLFEDESGASTWHLDIASYVPPATPIGVRSELVTV